MPHIFYLGACVAIVAAVLLVIVVAVIIISVKVYRQHWYIYSLQQTVVANQSDLYRNVTDNRSACLIEAKSYTDSRIDKAISK